MRDIFYGKDLNIAFPREENYMVMCAELIKPFRLYSVKETHYNGTNFEVRFEEIDIWKPPEMQHIKEEKRIEHWSWCDCKCKECNENDWCKMRDKK